MRGGRHDDVLDQGRVRRARDGRAGAAQRRWHRRGSRYPVPLTEIAEHDGYRSPTWSIWPRVCARRGCGSRRGARGGYLLARPAGEITMAEVVEALEGSIAPIECISLALTGACDAREASPAPASLPDEASVVTGTRLDRAHAAETTLADLVLELGTPAAATELPSGAALASDRTLDPKP